MANLASVADPELVVDALNNLLASEQNNLIRFMDEGSPYLARASGDKRRSLSKMVPTHTRHCSELYGMIEYLGGVPENPKLEPEEQYMAFLSFDFIQASLDA